MHFILFADFYSFSVYREGQTLNAAGEIETHSNLALMHQGSAVERKAAQPICQLHSGVACGNHCIHCNAVACQIFLIVGEIGLCSAAVDQHILHQVVAIALGRIGQDHIGILADRIGICQRQTVNGNGNFVHHLGSSHIDGEFTVCYGAVHCVAVYGHCNHIGFSQCHLEVHTNVVL